MTNLSFDGAMKLFVDQQSEPFPVDFDYAWEWLGYSRKDHAKTALVESGFLLDIDFSRKSGESTGGRPSELITLTVDCFKQWGMMAGTEQGKQIRRYFLECERIVKMKAESPNLQDIQDPFWQLVDGARARGLEVDQAIDWRHRFDGVKAPSSSIQKRQKASVAGNTPQHETSAIHISARDQAKERIQAYLLNHENARLIDLYRNINSIRKLAKAEGVPIARFTQQLCDELLIKF